MALTPNEIAGLVNALRSKFHDAQCLRCKSNDWMVDGVLQIYLATTKDKGLAMGGPFLPTGVLICRNCGTTELVNLVIAGIVQGAQ